VLPAMLTQSLYRYTIVAIPLACIAAGLAFVKRAGEPAAAAGGTAVAQGPASASGTRPHGLSSADLPPADRADTPDP
jgi:hypothetical protein